MIKDCTGTWAKAHTKRRIAKMFRSLIKVYYIWKDHFEGSKIDIDK